MLFIIPINEPEIDENGKEGSVTYHHLNTGSDCARTNKRILKEYLTKMGCYETEHKKILKSLGFWGKTLGA